MSAMQLTTITFERVFDIGAVRGPAPFGNRFSFASGATQTVKARAAAKPALRDGMTVTAALAKRDDWKTILGWVDHGTGTVTAPPLAPTALLFAAVAYATAMHAYLWVIEGLGPGRGLAVLCLSIWLILLGSSTWDVLAARRALNRFAAKMRAAEQ